ncbi:survival motor neuron protein-like isoform X3 [Esox lucius]|uniref:survival motor neuron protein-like isoform X3 n=1 Tax=Esox lucius TaxID=8010 RepID=UPI001476A92A|nr:survival motor neuron protein-like isoform X3 [Esox lucius]
MAYDESIVFRSGVAEDKGPIAVATDDFALVKAYEEALITFRWQVGSHCQAVWSVDGLVYPATVVWVEGECCKVKFDNYGNEEEMDLSALLPDAANQPKQEILSCKDETDSDEKVGNNPPKPRESILPKSCVLCKGLIDPKDVKGLGPSRKNWADYEKTDQEWKSSQLGQREELLSPQPTTFPSGKECGKSSYSLDRNQLDKPSSPKGQTASGRADPNLHFSFYPPVPPPKGFLDFLPPIPPPPPPSTCVRPPQPGHVEPGNGLDSVMTDLSTMLLSWYLCGYHTGCYTAVQQMNASLSSDGKKKQAK